MPLEGGTHLYTATYDKGFHLEHLPEVTISAQAASGRDHPVPGVPAEGSYQGLPLQEA